MAEGSGAGLRFAVLKSEKHEQGESVDDKMDRFGAAGERTAQPKWLRVKCAMQSKTRSTTLLTIGITIGLLLGGLATWAATSGVNSAQIPYTGHLQHNGGPVTGEVGMRFRLYPSALSETVLWEETHDPSADASRERVDVQVGQFSVMLGTYEDIDAPTLRQATLFLGIEILDENGDAVPLGGRQQVGALPFAWGGAPGQNFTVDGDLVCNGCVTSDAVRFDAIDASKIAPNAVGESEIAADAVRASEIAANAVGGSEIADGSIGPWEFVGNMNYGSTFTAAVLRASGGNQFTRTVNFYNNGTDYNDIMCP